MIYRDAIKLSLEKMDSGKLDIPMSFPYLLMSFASLLNGVSAMYVDSENPTEVTVKEVLNVLKCGENSFISHMTLFTAWWKFLNELLDKEIPESIDQMWYDDECIISLWNEFAERKS